MKTTFLLIIFSTLLFVSCGKKNENDSKNKYIEEKEKGWERAEAAFGDL